MTENTTNEGNLFLECLREEIKSCMREVLSAYQGSQTNDQNLPLTLTLPQFCQQMNISRPAAYELVNTKGFPAFRVGTKYLINSRGLQEWMNNQSIRE